MGQSSIQILSTELLSEILHYHFTDEEPARKSKPNHYAPLYVCHAWRAISEERATNWTTIRLFVAYGPLLRKIRTSTDPDIEIASWLERIFHPMLRRLTVVADRQPINLWVIYHDTTVDCDFLPGEEQLLENIDQAVTARFAQCFTRRVRLASYNEVQRMYSASSTSLFSRVLTNHKVVAASATQLRAITVIHPDSSAPVLPNMYFPRLEKVAVTAENPFEFCSPFILRNLTCLNLANNDPGMTDRPDTQVDLAELLQAAPVLQILSISFLEGYLTNITQDYSTTPHLGLRRLILDTPTPMVIAVLNYLLPIFPQITHLLIRPDPYIDTEEPDLPLHLRLPLVKTVETLVIESHLPRLDIRTICAAFPAVKYLLLGTYPDQRWSIDFLLEWCPSMNQQLVPKYLPQLWILGLTNGFILGQFQDEIVPLTDVTVTETLIQDITGLWLLDPFKHRPDFAYYVVSRKQHGKL